MKWEIGKTGETVISPEDEKEILEDCEKRLNELARVLFAVWQRQEPTHRQN
jgi:hypothetical protein